MPGIARLLSVLLLLNTLPVSAQPRAFVSNERSGDVSVIDAATNKVNATIPVGKRPRGLQISPDKKFLYVALSGMPITPPGQERSDTPSDKSADAIGVIDLATLKLVDKLPSGSDPEQFAVSLDGSKLYISNEDINSATVVDIPTKKTIATIKVGTEPEGVAISPDGKFVYVTSESTNEVHVIDTANSRIIIDFKTPERPRAIAFLPDGSKAYITCETAGRIAVVETASHQVIKSIGEGAERIRPMGVTTVADGSRVYVGCGRAQSVLVIDPKTDQILKTIASVGQRVWGVALTPDGRFLYTANGPSNDVSCIDTQDFSVRRIPAGQSPWGVAIAP
jgi:PQQ-dependent catabolism-associated beta-propeller protein